MGLAYGIWLVVLGVLGAANLIIAKRPDAKQVIDKLTPYQGWIGAVGAVTGLLITVQALLNIGVMKYAPIWWMTWVAMGVIIFCLGLLLGVGVIKSFVKQPQAVAKMDELIVKLAPKQGLLGLISIGLGIWGIVANLFFMGSPG